MESSPKFTLEATVRGKVQGVFFRSFVNHHARALGLKGYVRNRPDGSVEVKAEGERQPLEALVRYLWEGPPHAEVEKVEVRWSEYKGIFQDFQIRY